VLDAALRQARAWRQSGLYLGISVNLSARTLHDTHLPDAVRDLLRQHETAPHSLTLEVTESALMTDPARAQEVLGRLTAIGVRIAIDDFGTGYSSLGYLKTLPVHELKIDKSFVLTMDAAATKDVAIVRSVVAMAQALGLEVVAEGVETASAWQVLRILGCTLAQGHYVSRPLPADKLSAWLRASPWGRSQSLSGTVPA
jgi:EAL domain-containing protein (putative c-di-GMP-specific phosphodiesterase class I)